jgi:hypothetical protein
MTCEPNPITLPILLAIALFAWMSRNRTELGWYRGCGRDRGGAK